MCKNTRMVQQIYLRPVCSATLVSYLSGFFCFFEWGHARLAAATAAAVVVVVVVELLFSGADASPDAS